MKIIFFINQHTCRTPFTAKMGLLCNAKCRLLSMLCLTFFFFCVEIFVGYWSNSTALIADSFHMLSDVVALVIAYVSVRMSPKKWSKNTFGWARAEVLGALINAVFLVALCFSILIESFKRFADPEKLHNPILVFWVGVVGLIVNIIGLFLFHEHSGHGHGGGHHMQLPIEEVVVIEPNETKNALVGNGNGAQLQTHEGVSHSQSHGNGTVPQKPSSKNMNMQGVFLHVLADALGSVIVIISALVVTYTDWKYNVYVDPALSVIMVVIITHTTLPLLMDSAMILLQTVPTHIQIDSLQRKLLENIDGVLAVHEFHVWQLAGDRIIASAHIRCRNLHDYMQIAEQVKEFFHNEGIHSTTIQPEFVEFEAELPVGKLNRPMDNCALDCPPGQPGVGNGCLQNTCCGPQQDKNRKSPSSVELDDGAGCGGAEGTPRNGRKHNKRKSGGGGSSSDSDLIPHETCFHAVNVVGDSSKSAAPSLTDTTKMGSSHKIPLIAKDDQGNISSCSSTTTLSGSKEKLNILSDHHRPKEV